MKQFCLALLATFCLAVFTQAADNAKPKKHRPKPRPVQQVVQK